METELVWQDRFNIGVEHIDKEHKKIFSVINKLLMSNAQADKRAINCQESIKYFKDHALKHFTEEEAYMASINYKGFETHRHLHDGFRKKILPELEKELGKTNYSANSVSHFLGVCTGWLIGHTLTEDFAITGNATSKWESLLPDDEQRRLSQTIIHLLYDMFRLESRVISEHYGGEKFGEGIYYRLVYNTQKNETWQIILAFEEKLLLHTIGSILGGKSNKLDTMMVNTTRYTARQFVERVQAYSSSADLYEIKEENLLTYEQLQEIFEDKSPQFSFLFDTGAGYFAYSVIAPHLLQKDFGTSIKAENAMSEVQNYLNKNELNKAKNRKKKILVVDDSCSMRQEMKQLLGTDYDVALANSGLSAIRSITLNKPDLILLDYEMPVCDGSQVLEMIRSEKDFEDIPVIFLTSKADREGVSKVIPLNPIGYLLKTMKPADIKKNIDNYFLAARKSF